MTSSRRKFCRGVPKAQLIRAARSFWKIGMLDSSSTFQLAFKLVEEAPIRAVCQNLVGGRPDQAGLAQPQRIESDSVIGIVVPPSCVRDFLERLQRIVIASCISRIDNPLRDPLRLVHAKIGGFKDRAHDALGCDWIPAYIVAVSRYHAAEILRPWAVRGAVEDHVADVARSQILRIGRPAEERVDLSRCE